MVQVHAAWHLANHEKKSAYDKAYRATHRELVLAYNASYHAAHREEAARKYAARHEENAANTRRYRARKRNAHGSHIAADVRAQYDRQRGVCYWCGDKLPWRHKHVDHVVPLILGGSNGPENLVVACSRCNLSKKDKHPMDWAGILF